MHNAAIGRKWGGGGGKTGLLKGVALLAARERRFIVQVSWWQARACLPSEMMSMKISFPRYHPEA